MADLFFSPDLSLSLQALIRAGYSVLMALTLLQLLPHGSRGTGTRPKAVVAAIRDILRWWTRWVLLRQRQDFGRGRVVSS